MGRARVGNRLLTATLRPWIVGMPLERRDLHLHPVGERQSPEQAVEFASACGAVEAKDRALSPPDPHQMPLLGQPTRCGCLGGLAVLDRGLRGSVWNVDVELDQELHVPQTTSLAADTVAASRMTPATISGLDSITRWEAPSTSVTVEPARAYWKRCSSGATRRSAVPNTPQDRFARHA